MWKLKNWLFGWHYAYVDILFTQKICRVYTDEDGRPFAVSSKMAVYLDVEDYRADGLYWQHNARPLTFPARYLKEGFPVQKKIASPPSVPQHEPEPAPEAEWEKISSLYSLMGEVCPDLEVSSYCRSISADLVKLIKSGVDQSTLEWKTYMHSLQKLAQILGKYDVENYRAWPEEIKGNFESNVRTIAVSMRGQITAKEGQMAMRVRADLEALKFQLNRLDAGSAR